MTCPNCGKNNKDNEPFCGYCGAALVRAKTQKNVQKAVDAYVRKPRKTEEKNLIPAIIIICLCVLLVVVLILVIPKLIDMLGTKEQAGNNSSAPSGTSLPSQEEGLSTSNPYYECYRAYNTYVLTGSDSSYVTRSVLKDLSDAELTIALQEIYARHGYSFQDAELNAYFENRTWYTPSATPSALNTYETANVILLEVYIDQKNGTLAHRGNSYLDALSEEQDYVCKNSDTEYLTAEDLKDLEEEALTVAQWELYARRGHINSDQELQEYFCSKEWYIPTGTVSNASFNEFETDNETLIGLYLKRAEGVYPSIDSPYLEYFQLDSFIFPNSDSQLLSEDTFLDSSLTEEKCILGRNEIYARHGFVFSDQDLTNYFLCQEWYLPSAPIGDLSKLQLNATEKKNIEHLDALETAFKTVPDTSSLDKSMTYTVTHDKVSFTLPAYWKDYTNKTADGTMLSFRDNITANIYGGDTGLVCSFNVVAAADYSGPEDVFRKIGVLTDAEGNEWYVTRYTPSDVQHCFLAIPLSNQMNSDLSRIQITPAEGYTYTAY